MSGSGARMRDVAKRAGVSTMTVSRALNEPSKVSPEMRERVIRAVKEIGYLPNHLARSLSSTRSTTVGLIVPSIDNSIYTQTIKGLSDVIKRSGFQLMIAECGYDALEEEELIKAFLAHRVSGLILHSTQHSAEAEAMIRQAGVPVVENGNLPRKPLDMAVSYSNREAAQAMTLHLGRLGYKKIAFASLYSVNNERSRERIEGYLAALAQLGQTPDPRLMIETSRGLAAGAEIAARVIQNVPEVDALFCAGDVGRSRGGLRSQASTTSICSGTFRPPSRRYACRVTTSANARRKCCSAASWMEPTTCAAASSTSSSRSFSAKARSRSAVPA
jgi:LacI family gluconate utilization system Gnt-I transcriptional repressor